MQFFDLNIPYLEEERNASSSVKTLAADNKEAAAKNKKKSRLNLVVKAMELGYSGVAFNRTITGVISESYRCSISLFPMSSLLKIHPSLSSSATFHRLLLGVSADTPFRQYTRLTVAVDNSAQTSALNSRNPILKGYDLVAVRPLNQNVFEQACQSSEVDLISIDFSDKLPFRLKPAMVKAAVARGIFFEINYSSLIEDAQMRKQLITNAKSLVDWTHGRNLIVSSSASSVLGLRGPTDVANLLTLLGLPVQRAKAAISRNCRSMITSALKKKQFYKESIRVEAMPSHGQSSSKEPWIVDWMKWDPISSGEGDLLLEDMAKSFSDVNKASKTAKVFDFTSDVEIESMGGSKSTDGTFKIGDLSHRSREPREAQKVTLSSGKTVALLSTGLLDSQVNILENSKRSLPLNSSEAFANVSEAETSLPRPEEEVVYAGRSISNIIRPCSVHATSTSLANMLLEESLKFASGTSGQLDVLHTNNSTSTASGLFEDPDLHASRLDSEVVEIGNGISSADSSVDVMVSANREVNYSSNDSLASWDLPFREGVTGRGSYQKSVSEASLQTDGMLPIDVEGCTQHVNLNLQTDSKNVETGSLVSAAKVTNNIDFAIDSLQEDITEVEDCQESETKGDTVMHTDNSPDRKNRYLPSGNSVGSKEVVKNRGRKANHIKLKKDGSSASFYPADANIDQSENRRGDDDDELMMEVLPWEQNLRRNHNEAKNLLSQETMRAVHRKMWRRIPPRGFRFSFKHWLPVSFKRKTYTSCKLRRI